MMAGETIPVKFQYPILSGGKDGFIELEEDRIVLAGKPELSASSGETFVSSSGPHKLAIDLDDVRWLGFFHSGWHRLSAAMATPTVFRRSGVESHHDFGMGGSQTVFQGELVEDPQGASPLSVHFHIEPSAAAVVVQFLAASRAIDGSRKRRWLRSNRVRMWLCVAAAPVPVLGLVTVFTLFRGVPGLSALGRALGEERSFTVARASTIAWAALGANVLTTGAMILLSWLTY